ncbi:MAG: hypothetical protein KDA25_13460, partial [Phycisphaerales bacterium]|nr:hypothetical protein [Phycisphaerales bacterium]
SLRVVVILALLVQQLALPVALHADGRPGAAPGPCGTSCACASVTVRTCCGREITTHACGTSGGPCRCAARSQERQDTPKIPSPSTRADFVGLHVTVAFAPFVLPRATASRARPGRAWIAARSHQEARARLGIWRT